MVMMMMMMIVLLNEWIDRVLECVVPWKLTYYWHFSKPPSEAIVFLTFQER